MTINPGQTLIQPIDKQLLESCIHCGLCLPACPTYLATGREMESPRGRIYLLSQWNEGVQDLTPELTGHIESCLGCLGCQTACPSGVQYGSILSQARPHIAAMRPPLQRAVMRFSFEHVLPNYGLLKFGGSLLRLWQNLKLGRLLAWLALPTPEHERAAENGELVNPIRKTLYQIHVWESFMPRVPRFEAVLGGRDSESATAGTSDLVVGAKDIVSTVLATGPVASTTAVGSAVAGSFPIAGAASTADSALTDLAEPVQLFTGCVMDVFYNHVNRACSRLIQRQGREVQIPSQGCCGALAMHAGEVDVARALARRNIEFLEKTKGPIAVTAAGCGAMLKEYPELFHSEPSWLERAQRIATRSADITEVLSVANFSSFSKSNLSNQFGEKINVAYHAACHLSHAQHVRIAPDELLHKLSCDAGSENLKLIPLREAEHCCGSAGIYNLLNTEMSMKVLDRKMMYIEQCGANVVVTTNPGCMLQLDLGARKFGVQITVVHLAELLDAMYGGKK